MATYDVSNAIPYAPTHVGELINDELVASGLSVEQLSEKANIELIALNEIIRVSHTHYSCFCGCGKLLLVDGATMLFNQI